MPSSIESDQHLRWNAARRKRNQSRFEIRARMKEECSSRSPQKSQKNKMAKADEINDDNNDVRTTKQRQFLQSIALGSISFFSLQIFSKDYELLSEPLSTTLLSTYKIQTLCTSRFGPKYASDVLTYIQIKPCCTMFEYALMLGEYGIAHTFIAGGINPCDILHYYFYVDSRRNKGHEISFERVEHVSALVMKKLVVDFTPPSLVVYLAKCVFDLRLASHVEQSSRCTTNHCHVCTMKHCDDWPLLYLPFSDCIVCEVCLWEDLTNKLDERSEGNVFRCPVSDKYPNNCGKNVDKSPTTGAADDADDAGAAGTIDDEICSLHVNRTPTEKCQSSLSKFQSLPKDIKALKKLPRKSKKKMKIYSTWQDALMQTIGLSQDVRSDKFKRYVDIGATHHCRACLEAGVNINMTNEYNQTPLYLACWKNHVDLVEMFLQWGADHSIDANGMMSPWNVAEENNHSGVVQVLQKYSSNTNLHTKSLRERIGITLSSTKEEACHQSSRSISTLIHDKSHVGFGSFYIDNLFHDNIMHSLDELYQSIPIAAASEVKKKKMGKNVPCSLRHYFCDAEGYLRTLIGDHITNVLRNSNTMEQFAYKDLHAYVFPQMRFLNYDQPGGELLPHVDLTKVDTLSGKRSTHTFILYLQDCEIGGETALLQKLSELGPLSYHEIIQPTIKPRRNRILVFPHACPHQGLKVVSTPKILLRGEVLLSSEKLVN